MCAKLRDWRDRYNSRHGQQLRSVFNPTKNPGAFRPDEMNGRPLALGTTPFESFAKCSIQHCLHRT